MHIASGSASLINDHSVSCNNSNTLKRGSSQILAATTSSLWPLKRRSYRTTSHIIELRKWLNDILSDMFISLSQCTRGNFFHPMVSSHVWVVHCQPRWLAVGFGKGRVALVTWNNGDWLIIRKILPIRAHLGTINKAVLPKHGMRHGWQVINMSTRRYEYILQAHIYKISNSERLQA